MKEHYIEFYVNNFNYLQSVNDADVSFIPPMLRRRLSKLDKCTLSVLNKVFSDKVENIVFSSQYGEVERLLKIIAQYTQDNEVSPNTFSGSVHNYPLGFYLLNKQKSVSYTALAACENSISAGVLSTVIADYDNNVFCYCDICENDFISMAVNITKTPLPNSEKFFLTLNNNSNSNETSFEDYVKFFQGYGQRLDTPLYSIERRVDEK